MYYEAAMRTFMPGGAEVLILPYESVLSSAQFAAQISRTEKDALELVVDDIAEMQAMLS